MLNLSSLAFPRQPGYYNYVSKLWLCLQLDNKAQRNSLMVFELLHGANSKSDMALNDCFCTYLRLRRMI